ncbi:MAG: hypothetical protein HY287_04710 [Planctomycetes bacterium]|nr:hypothetical protein [Planctomycetota bacterium]MBI3833614.1 hypothetical protein [Planctomycetota bacterium]
MRKHFFRFVILSFAFGRGTIAFGQDQIDTALAEVASTIDFAAFPDCLDGPNAPVAAGCSTFNFHADTHIDLADFAVIQRGYALTPGPIQFSTETAGEINPIDDVDEYTFQGDFGSTVTVDFSTPTVNGRPDLVIHIDLVRPNGTIPASGTAVSCGTTARIDSFPLDTTGNWKVRVRAYESWNNCGYGADDALRTGLYTLTVCPSNTPPIAIAYGQTRTSVFSSDCQIVNFQFSGNSDDVVSIMYLGPAQTRHVQLYAPNGTKLGTSSGGSGASLNDIVLPLDGTYQIAVEATDNQPTGSFSIGLSELGGATHVGFNTPTGGVLSVPAEADTYSFDGVFGTTVTVDFTTPSVNGRPDVVSRVDLIRPNGTTATSVVSCGNNSRIDSYPIETSGTWTVRVRAYESWFNCGYGLDTNLIVGNYSLLICPSNAAPIAIAYGQTKDGSFAADCQIVNYQFTGALNDLATIMYLGPATTRRVQLFAPNGSSIGVTGGGQGVSLTDVQLPLSGSYRISVEAADNQPFGNFSIGLSKLSTATPVVLDTLTPGNLALIAGADVYSFPGVFGSTVTVDFSTPSVNSRPDLVVRLDLLRPNGSMATSTVSCGQTVRLDDVPMDATGTWTARVRAYESWFNCGYGADTNLLTGNFSLAVCTSDSPATPIAYGQSHDGSFSTDCQIDNYSFVGTHGDMVTIVYFGPGYVRRIQLLGPDGNPVGPASGAGQGTSLTDMVLPIDGTYIFSVEAQDNQALGNYSVSLNKLSGATPIAFDTATADSLSQIGEVDSYSFPGVFGSTVTVDFSTPSVNNRPDIVVRLDLLRPNGTTASSTPSCGQTTRLDNFAMDATGTWTARVRAYESWFNCGYGADTSLLTGNFSLAVCTSNAPATPIAFGQSHNGSFSVDCQIDNYSFTGTHGDVVTIVYLGPGYARRIQLFGPDGNPIGPASGAGQGTSLTDMVLPIDGTYTFSVEAQDNQALGNYSVSLNKLSGATPIAFDTATPGSLSQIGEVDSYSFTGTFGTTVTVDFQANAVGNAPDIVTRLELVGPNGAVFNSTPTCGVNARLDTVSLNDTGTWTIRIRAYESWFNCGYGTNTDILTGAYTVAVSASNSPVTAIAYGQTRNGNLIVDSQIVNYQFSGLAGDFVSALYFGQAYARRIQLFAPNGALIQSSGAGQGTAFIDVSLPIDGQYRIAVEAADNQPIGTFSIGLSELDLSTPISLNTPTPGSINNAGEVKQFSFNRTIGDAVTLDLITPLSNVKPDIPARLDLIRPDGTLATSTPSCGTTARTSTFTIDQTGKWTARVRVYESWQNCGFGADAALLTGSFTTKVCTGPCP